MISLKGKKILVTGAGGFIGSHLVERLILEGSRVRAFVHYNSRNDWGLLEDLQKDIITSVEVYMGDLKDPDAVRRAVRGNEAVFHLGALVAIPYSYIHPMDFVQTNIVGTVHVLNACLEYGIERLIHASTSEVYGTACYMPIDEGHPLQGQSPYSASKIGADKMAESYHRAFGLPVATLRPFNTYGPRQSARAVIPTIMTQALTGDEIYLGSLYPARDFTYVRDTVEGFLKVAESGKAIGQVIHIGSGEEISIGDLAEMIISLIGSEKKVVVDKKRIRPEESEVDCLVCNPAKAREVIDWMPSTSLEEGLKVTLEWIRENIDRYKADIYHI